MTTIRVADYIVGRLAEAGIGHIFMVAGGGAMHLDDALGRRADLSYVCNHHEQACAIAAEGYSRVGHGLAGVCVTTGPGGTNTLTGVLGQWHDSIPVVYISGQVRHDTTVASTGMALRQLGDQEGSIIDIVAPVTKYAAMVTRAKDVSFHLERALYLATAGRPGPVWIDVPVDVQGAQVDDTALEEGRRRAEAEPRDPDSMIDDGLLDAEVDTLISRLERAERPVLLAGRGIRAAGARDLFRDVAATLGAPVVTAWNAHDVMYDAHTLYVGRQGINGERAANFAVQNSDLLLSVGCRLSLRQVGYEHAAFARDAYRVVVDVDALELRKPTIAPNLPIHADAAVFLRRLQARLGERHWDGGMRSRDWLEWCVERRCRYPVVLPEYRDPSRPINPYAFVETLSDHCESNETVVVANGACCIIGFQAFKVKLDQELIGNSGTASMGYDLPAAIGACFASGGGRVVLMAGEGSIQMNLQELQTIIHHRLPIKIFLFENGGYSSIRQTQDNVFGGHRVGEGRDSGVSFPNMIGIARAYGIPARRIDRPDEVPSAVAATLAREGPALLAVVMDPAQEFVPKVTAAKLPDGSMVSRPLEDMYPFLERDELAENLLIQPWNTGKESP